MEILKNHTVIDKWELLQGELIEPIRVLQRPSFKLIPKHPIHKSVLQCCADIHVTSLDTDFILDTTLISLITFDTTNIPTIDNLYDA